MARKVKLHMSDMRPNLWGGVTTSTLCRRSKVMDDGMNIADDESKVTCLFCLKELRAKKERDAKDAKEVKMGRLNRDDLVGLERNWGLPEVMEQHVGKEVDYHLGTGVLSKMDGGRYGILLSIPCYDCLKSEIEVYARPGLHSGAFCYVYDKAGKYLANMRDQVYTCEGCRGDDEQEKEQQDQGTEGPGVPGLPREGGQVREPQEERSGPLGEAQEATGQGAAAPQVGSQEMSEGCFYFGCWGQVGHYLRDQHGESMGYGKASKKTGIPEEVVLNIDGGFLPKDTTQGRAAIHHVDGWTILAFTDRSVDSRPGSNSAFIALGTLTFSHIVERSKKFFPDIWSRFKFEVFPDVPEESYNQRIEVDGVVDQVEGDLGPHAWIHVRCEDGQRYRLSQYQLPEAVDFEELIGKKVLISVGLYLEVKK